MKLDSGYSEYFPEYSISFGRSLILLKCMHGRDNSGKSFSDELIEWFIESGFIQYQNNYLIGDICSPTAYTRTLKYFFADAVNHKERVHN